jgi:hypothetical protein
MQQCHHGASVRTVRLSPAGKETSWGHPNLWRRSSVQTWMLQNLHRLFTECSDPVALERCSMYGKTPSDTAQKHFDRKECSGLSTREGLVIGFQAGDLWMTLCRLRWSGSRSPRSRYEWAELSSFAIILSTATESELFAIPRKGVLPFVNGLNSPG